MYVIASGKFGTEVNTGLLTYTSLCMAELFSFRWVQCVYGFGVGIGYQVKVNFCNDRNTIDTSDVMWGTIRVPIQGVLRGITGLGMIVCCCNVTVTTDGLKLKHRGMTVCSRGRKLIAFKVCVTGVRVLGWQKSSNSCLNADRSVYRSLPLEQSSTHNTPYTKNGKQWKP